MKLKERFNEISYRIWRLKHSIKEKRNCNKALKGLIGDFIKNSKEENKSISFPYTESSIGGINLNMNFPSNKTTNKDIITNFIMNDGDLKTLRKYKKLHKECKKKDYCITFNKGETITPNLGKISLYMALAGVRTGICIPQLSIDKKRTYDKSTEPYFWIKA